MSERLLTPQQENFLAYYLDPKSETFSNAYKSALRAEYSEEYAQNITGQFPNWLSESISDASLIAKAEKALSEALDYLTVNEEGKVDSGVARVKLEATKLVLKGLKKDKYSERAELTGKNGADLPTPLLAYVRTDNSSEETPSPEEED